VAMNDRVNIRSVTGGNSTLQCYRNGGGLEVDTTISPKLFSSDESIEIEYIQGTNKVDLRVEDMNVIIVSSDGSVVVMQLYDTETGKPIKNGFDLSVSKEECECGDEIKELKDGIDGLNGRIEELLKKIEIMEKEQAEFDCGKVFECLGVRPEEWDKILERMRGGD